MGGRMTRQRKAATHALRGCQDFVSAQELHALLVAGDHAIGLTTVYRARPKDWTAFQKHAVDFHLRNAAAWANAATGLDLAAQVDPDFRHGPEALAALV